MRGSAASMRGKSLTCRERLNSIPSRSLTCRCGKSLTCRTRSFSVQGSLTRRLQMNAVPTHKKDWSLTSEAFNRMLLSLDEDREAAGEKYEAIRAKLNKLFRWRGCASPDEYTDETIDRVARRLSEGAELRTEPYLFFHGVALNVLREHWKQTEQAPVVPIGSLGPQQLPFSDTEELEQRANERRAREQQLDCLDRCLGALAPHTRRLLLNYHHSEGRERVETRERLADFDRLASVPGGV